MFLAATLTLNDLKVDAEIDAVIRKAEIIDGVKIATELVGFGRGGEVPSLKSGSITTYDAKRLSD